MEFGHLEGVAQPYLGDLRSPWFVNLLLTGMILQVLDRFDAFKGFPENHVFIMFSMGRCMVYLPIHEWLIFIR